jgi:hypothetical protein
VEISRFIRRLRREAAGALGAAALLGMLLLPFPSAPGQAPLPGAEAPELTAAVDNWLQGEEEGALHALADLARDGNDAARLLLAIIDKTPALQGPWLAHLPREERIALLRQPGGLSGRSWLHALADHPLGAVWLALMDPATGPEAIATFTELGETRAARVALVLLAARGHPRLRQIDPADVDPELIYLLLRGADDARRAALLDRVEPGSAQRALLDGTLDTSQLQEWLAGSAIGGPLDAVCSEHCAATRPTCLSNAYKALASHNALLTLGSPVEALIPQEHFLAQPRGRSSVLRRILQSRDARGRRVMIAQVREHDACLADVLEGEAAHYRYRRPGSESNDD